MKPAHVLGNQSTKTMFQFFDVSRAVDPYSFSSWMHSMCGSGSRRENIEEKTEKMLGNWYRYQ